MPRDTAWYGPRHWVNQLRGWRTCLGCRHLVGPEHVTCPWCHSLFALPKRGRLGEVRTVVCGRAGWG